MNVQKMQKINTKTFGNIFATMIAQVGQGAIIFTLYIVGVIMDTHVSPKIHNVTDQGI